MGVAMSYLDRIAECNRWHPERYRPFSVAGTVVGRVRHDFAERLAAFPEVFHVSEAAVILDPALDTVETRSAAVERVMRALAAEGAVPGWRNEVYPVGWRFGAPPFFTMERAAFPAMGLRAFGVHLNGYVREGGRLFMWIGRRAYDKHTYPGMLDNTVAGGQPYGLSLIDNLIKECKEEAAIPPELARQAVPVSAITYCAEEDGGLKPDVQFCYDLELPAGFTPHNTDGEIHEFYRWPIEKVAEIVRDTQEFKFNCNLVIIDFLVRHGLIPPDHPDYLDIVKGLRQ
jgi:isopentenyldiphosphate isomerase